MPDSWSDPEISADAAEFDRIEAALAESDRGRRFLAEFARRHRAADTDVLLRAIARLEGVVVRHTEPGPGGAGPDERAADRDREAPGLAALAGAAVRARAEIAAMGSERDRPVPEAEAFEAIVPAAERATAAILAAAEAMQEVAWTLREKGAEAASCDRLDRRAAEICAACAAQDLTVRRTARALQALHDLEQGVAATIADRPPAPEPGFGPVPFSLPGGERGGPAASAAPDTPAAGPSCAETGGTDDLAAAFADLDRLSIEEKIALFS